MGPNSGFQHAGPQHPSQSIYHSGTKPPTSVGPSYPLGQPPLLSHPPPQSMYQGGGMHLGAEYSNQVGTSMQADRGSWMSGPPESSSVPQLSGPPSLVPGQMPGSQLARGTALTPEEEKALLQQVMILTPEQINLLPPEQKKTVANSYSSINAPIKTHEILNFQKGSGTALSFNFRFPARDFKTLSPPPISTFSTFPTSSLSSHQHHHHSLVISSTKLFSISPTTSFSTPSSSSSSSSSKSNTFDLLQQQFSAQNFREADEETRRLLIVLAGEAAQTRGYVFFSEVQFIPEADLKAIDDLWRQHHNRFGYSVQKRIFFDKVSEDFTNFSSKSGG
ncbi:hypothetical protein M0R45_023531 [Rubus argutus]|uniref:Uncharacterized protein n=1 Tax=Rubus argutus TaxID=59490 RepID=A0AAW1WRL6_RUBAR